MPLRVLQASGNEIKVDSSAGVEIGQLRLELSKKMKIDQEALDLLVDGVIAGDKDKAPDSDVLVIVSKYKQGLCLEWSKTDSASAKGVIAEVNLGPGNVPHTIAALITWPKKEQFPPTRSWILNLGQKGAGAHHWLWNPSRKPYPQVAQLGAWCGKQSQREMPAVPGVSVRVVVTFDGDTLIVYLDGQVHDVTQGESFNFSAGRQKLHLVEALANGESDFPGEIHEISIWLRALPPEEVSALNPGSNNVSTIYKEFLQESSMLKWSKEESATTTGIVGHIKLGPGNAPHSIVAFITWPEKEQFPLRRSWILNLGQENAGAHHWLWNPSRTPYPEVAQLGVWSGTQSQKELPAVPETRVCLVVTFDGEVLTVYLDGCVHEVIKGVCFNFQGGQQKLRLAEAPVNGESMFTGEIHEVTVWPRPLLPQEISSLLLSDEDNPIEDATSSMSINAASESKAATHVKPNTLKKRCQGCEPGGKFENQPFCPYCGRRL
eukprot:gnl/MRDRNA2_/MRDRNA2_190352_c0_seq1.p1 gnl/MRDRNA2_/MRDRNA2_190352_c0~~gnl/MRDRNA2_/MRDRNA2_190352_c0_seq1.p1  ORF type:complete len:491 (-),score=88.99 gnl/MRDRNA2_/MRDRNA2_190352_c0_seq1:224-1696(-)